MLDVVFYFEEGDGIGKAADHNISDAFEKKIGQLKKKTAKTDISTLIYSVACKNDIEMIFDPDFDRKECNYALCIPVYDRELDIFNRFNLMTDIRYIEKTDANERWYRNDGYYQKNDNVSFTFCDWNKEDSKELYQQPWKYMIKGFDKYPFKRDTMFKPLQLRSNITSFKLLDYDIYNFLLPRYFYYVTKISEEDLKDKYSNIYDNPSMLWHFEEKAIGLLKEKYSFTEKMRFELLLENIMNILEDLVKVDVPSFFNTEIEIKKYISKLPKCFVNVNIFFSYFKKHKAAEKRTIILFIYSISVLIDNLCHNLDDLIMFNAINMTDEKMVSYKDKIKKFLDSQQLKDLIKYYRAYYRINKDLLQKVPYVIDNTRFSSHYAMINAPCGSKTKYFYPFQYLKRLLEYINNLLIFE